MHDDGVGREQRLELALKDPGRQRHARALHRGGEDVEAARAAGQQGQQVVVGLVGFADREVGRLPRSQQQQVAAGGDDLDRRTQPIAARAARRAGGRRRIGGQLPLMTPDSDTTVSMVSMRICAHLPSPAPCALARAMYKALL